MNDFSGISQQLMSIEFLVLVGASLVYLLESFEARDATGEWSQEVRALVISEIEVALFFAWHGND